MYIGNHYEQSMENRIIYDDGERLKYIGTIESKQRFNNYAVYVAREIEIPQNVKYAAVSIFQLTFPERVDYEAHVVGDNEGWSTESAKTDLELTTHMAFDTGLAVIPQHMLPRFAQCGRLAEAMRKLIEVYPVYGKLEQENGMGTIIDALYQHPDYKKYITKILFTGQNARQLKNIVEEMLATLPRKYEKSLMTQEEQVAHFLELAKREQDDTKELVDDNFIDRMKAHDAYQWVTQKLDAAGFALSDTQQFNSLQHAGLVLSSDERVMYNLSDMGAGKTLMTVESIMFAQMVTVYDAVDQLTSEEHNLENLKKLLLPSIHIIAPTLSMKSSWLKTFQIFVDVEKVSEKEYTYVIEHNGYEFNGTIHLSGFTVKGGTIHVADLLPPALTRKTDFLIIDEIHQLVNRSVKATKFIDKMPDEPLNIYDTYKTFVLSGTLADFTVEQWFNAIQFLGIPDKKWAGDNYSAADYHRKVSDQQKDLKNALSEMARDIKVKQSREFDPSYIGDDIVMPTPNDKRSSRETYFYRRYGAVIVSPYTGGDNNLEYQMTRGNFTTDVDTSMISVPNFELFYKMVSSSVVTAQSIQIATELFGEQAEQHKAQVIKTASPLNQTDLNILKRLHKIVSDADVYKSRMLATKIANSILNLNDGLQNKTIYDVLNDAASKNTKFLEYLTQLDVGLLEEIATSNLIGTPNLEDTEKFKIVKDILEKESNETFLIVVNTPEVAIQLSKALGVASLTKAQMRNELDYQDVIDELYTKQNIVIVPQHMIKSSLDLVQANRLIQYQLNTEISDIIQTQNRINRIGQTRETKAYYIATDVLQENIIEMFLETYRNIKVAHKGIVELFVDLDQQIDVVSDYLATALTQSTATEGEVERVEDTSSIETRMTFIAGDSRETFEVEQDVLEQMNGGQIIWYGDKLLVKLPSGETGILGTTQSETSAPTLVQLTSE